MDRDAIKPLLNRTKNLFPRLSHLWLDAGLKRTGQRQGLGREDPVPDGGGHAPPAQAPLHVGQSRGGTRLEEAAGAVAAAGL